MRRGLFVLLKEPPVPLLSELQVVEQSPPTSNRKVRVALSASFKQLVRRK